MASLLLKSTSGKRGAGPYNAALTREPFLFYEMRVTAKLIHDGQSDAEAVDRIVRENLFQYPTEKSLPRMARACLKRLKMMKNDSLVRALALLPSDAAKQICLYAIMKQHRLILDFMVTVIGEKFRLRETSFGRLDLNIYFMRLQEQDDGVAAWSDSTITKLKQVIMKMLVENDYIDNARSGRLNFVELNPVLEDAIRAGGEEFMLPAFNCFS